MNWRRNANSLSQNEKRLFINAVQALKNPYNPKPSTGPTNRYDQYVAWHFDAGNKHTPDGDPYRTVHIQRQRSSRGIVNSFEDLSWICREHKLV